MASPRWKVGDAARCIRIINHKKAADRAILPGFGKGRVVRITAKGLCRGHIWKFNHSNHIRIGGRPFQIG